jgi:hypothetical protein
MSRHQSSKAKSKRKRRAKEPLANAEEMTEDDPEIQALAELIVDLFIQCSKQ